MMNLTETRYEYKSTLEFMLQNDGNLQCEMNYSYREVSTLNSKNSSKNRSKL